MCAVFNYANKMATLKAADTFVGLMFGFIGGGLLSGAYLTNKSNGIILESGKLAQVYAKKLDDAERTAEHYKYLYSGISICVDHLEAENKKLKESPQILWNDVLLVGSVSVVATTVISAMMR